MSKSSITTRRTGNPNWVFNPHAGDMLLEEFLKPLELSQNALARAIKVSPRRINEIVHGKRAVTADTDLRLCRYFGLHDGFFLGLQNAYELMEHKRRLGGRLDEIVPMRAAKKMGRRAA